MKNLTLFFLPGFLVLAAERIGAAAIESETMAEPLDLIFQRIKRFAKTLICEENETIENSRERDRKKN